MSDTEWSKELTAAYRKWLFTGPEGDLDTTDEDWLSDLQERAFEGGWLAALATTGGETEWGVYLDGEGKTESFPDRGTAEAYMGDNPGDTLMSRVVTASEWVAVDPTKEDKSND